MAITTAICNSFKLDLMNKVMDLEADTLRFALYTSAATINKDTTAYTATNESSGAGYTAKGEIAANPTVALFADTATLDCDDVTWTTVTTTARGTLLYDDSVTTPANDRAIAAWDFGGDKSPSAVDFTIQMPVAGAATALLQLA